MLAISMSFTVAFADEPAGQTNDTQAGTAAQTTVAKETKPTPGVYEKNGFYYYKNPKTGKIRKDAGFVTWNGNRYYIQKGGKIVTGKTFKVGKYQYRAHSNGKIAVGVYKWGKGLYFSDPSNGRWVKIKSRRCQKGVKWKGNWYYLQTNDQVAVNRPVVINNLPYVADSKGICTRIAINETKNPVLKVARKQIGNHTKAQVKKYWTWYFHSKFKNCDATPWCAAFASWCYKHGGKYNKIRSVGNKGYVPSFAKFANKRGKWVKKSNAKGGDLIVFGRSQHIGIVERVYKGYIYTIEGNSGPDVEAGHRPGAVTRRVYKLSDSYIKGVIRP